MPQLYRGEEVSPFIPPIDLPGWLAQGWSKGKTTSGPAEVEEKPQEGIDRKAELEAMDWREVKAIAEKLGIEKPENGWDEAIPLIIEKEGGD